MAGKIVNKMMGILGLEDEAVDMDENEVNEEEEIEPVLTSNVKGTKVVNIHTAISAKVVIIKPTTFDEATNIVDDVRNRKIVVVNTTSLEPRIAQRLLDFIGGASYALSGELKDVGKGIYILSPSNVEVTDELKSDLTNKGLFAWTK